MATKVDEFLRFDKRIIERNLRGGIVSEKDYEKHLKSLPDLTEKAEWVPIPGLTVEEPDASESGE